MNPFPDFDLFKEVVFIEHVQEAIPDRFHLPLFFIVGGVDDEYLSQLLKISPNQLLTLIQSRSQNHLPVNAPFGVFASRATLTTSYARIFPLESFLQPEWPILKNIQDPSSYGTKIPTDIERTWVIRALRRHGLNDLAEKVRAQMLKRIYPQKISSSKIPRPNQFSISTLSQLDLKLSPEQREYPAVTLVDDLPIRSEMTLGKMLDQISLTGCTQAQMATLKTSLQLLALS